MQATCTLKRLKYRLWDQGAVESWNLINSSFNADNIKLSDQGVKEKVVDLLVKVAEWPEIEIHIGVVPPGWFTKISDLYAKLADRITYSEALIGSDATIAGQPAGGGGVTGGFTGVGVLSPEQFVQLLRSQGATDAETVAMAGVAATESGFDTTSVQKGGFGRGLFQIDCGDPRSQHPDISEQQALDANFNTNWCLEAVRGRVAGGASLLEACGPYLFYGPRDRPGVAAEGRSIVEAALRSSPPPTAGTPPPPAPNTQNAGAQVVNAEGIRWTSEENLKPNVFAAKQFVQKMWPEIGANIHGYATGGHATNSDHYTGHALDLGVMDGQGRLKQLGNSMALWFCQNPHVFGTKYVIWQAQMLDGQSPNSGWFGQSDHFDHVHVSFIDQDQMGPAGISPGEMPWSLGGPDHFEGGFVDGTGIAPSGTGGGGGLGSAPGSPLNVYNWAGGVSSESALLYGVRALMNDDPILDTVATLMGVSMRSYMAAPNGDFIGWFPDYFGIYGTAAKMIIQDIELKDFTIVWDDSRLITHQFTAGAPVSDPENLGGGAVNEYQKFMTAGIVTVEFEEVMEALLNIKPGEGIFGDAKKIFERFGARKSYESMGTITGNEAEFWYAVHLFQRNWADQFSTNIPTTFMPELFPGMLAQLPQHKIQCYITQVSHSFDFSSGGGFTTDATVIAPSATDGSGLYGLTKAL